MASRGASGPARGATVDPAVLAPLPAYGTRLRGIGFAEGDRPSRLVVELLDEFAGTGGTHLLRLYPSRALGGGIERLAHIAGRARERLRHLACRFVAEIADASLRLAEHLVLAALQPRVAARMLDAGRLASD